MKELCCKWKWFGELCCKWKWFGELCCKWKWFGELCCKRKSFGELVLQMKIIWRTVLQMKIIWWTVLQMKFICCSTSDWSGVLLQGLGKVADYSKIRLHVKSSNKRSDVYSYIICVGWTRLRDENSNQTTWHCLSGGVAAGLYQISICSGLRHFNDKRSSAFIR